MESFERASRVVRIFLLAVVAAMAAYLAVLALRPSLRAAAPAWLSWFGQPGSWQTISIVIGVIVALCVLSYRSPSSGAGSVSLTIVLGLTTLNLVLAFASFWQCHDSSRPPFFTPLMWTALVVKGTVTDQSLSSHVCPAQTPVALEVARLSALGVIFVSVASVAVALFRTQLDRTRARLARSVTVVVGVDDDSQSMVSAVASTLEPTSQLILATDNPERSCVADCRREGARVIPVDPARSETIETLPFWRKLDRLYLLDADPVTNLDRLRAIGGQISAAGVNRRIPLIIRIDDPWYAAAWRAGQFGGSDTRWAADTVGKYEVTARRLLDQVSEDGRVTHILICGTSPLTLALCADQAQRELERKFYTERPDRPVPAITLVAEAAEEYLRDHEYRQQQLGLPSGHQRIDAAPEPPSMHVLAGLIGADGQTDVGTRAVIFVDAEPGAHAGMDPTIGSRLAVRFPTMRIYVWDPNAAGADNREPLLGQLRTYRLTMDLPAGQAHDAWERAAMLIHERYAAAVGGTSPARRPWAELDEFYRGSNRRQVRNALWIVEQIGGHTWNSVGGRARETAPWPPSADPLEQLAAMGFDRSTALAMARAEHEDWCRYYRRAGWHQGDPRDDDRKVHPKLCEWSVIEANPGYLNDALTSLAATLSQLRELGYRSQPVWQQFRRIGVVTAEQQHRPWTWTTESGQAMRAAAGDWLLEDSCGHRWSVRDDIFRATYEHIAGRRWRSKGLVLARVARPGETISTLEGSATAGDGAWIVKGEAGEQWPVPAAEFAQRYQGPVG
jgi:hypothetical protein